MSDSFQSLAKKGSIHVFRDGLPSPHFDDEDTRKAILTHVRSLESSPNYWIGLDAIRANDLRTPAERIVAKLYDRCIRPHVLSNPSLSVSDPAAITGAEYWTQVYRNGRGLAFHVDKDEHAMKTRGAMINPVYSSVFYLTGGERRGKDGRYKLQSPTVVTDEHFDQESRRMVPKEFPTESCLVFPRANRYLVFDGRAGHGVLDVNGHDGSQGVDGRKRDQDDVDHELRVTFLVNWWVQRPEGIERALGNSGAETTRSDWTAEDNGAHDGSAAKKEPVYALTITKEYLFANEPFMLDDFLREQDVLRDDNTVSPVIIRHSGVVMVPFTPTPESLSEDARHIVDCALISQENQCGA